jgi:hypothetical protein
MKYHGTDAPSTFSIRPRRRDAVSALACQIGFKTASTSSVVMLKAANSLARGKRSVSDAGYKNYDIDSISRSGSSVEIEATDTATGEIQHSK